MHDHKSDVICGGVVSCIVTVCVSTATSPPPLAVHVMVVLPMGNADGALLVITTGSVPLIVYVAQP
ncbi:MAG: hypothetical protein EB833_00880 [Thaumarchaeota archaeon S13]|nr:MAG: hypothetical protein EB833_00880 [Thaumarchaeota archaeon S13]